jgi:pimeloyl-ACP methyl ester carboxylesterase
MSMTVGAPPTEPDVGVVGLAHAQVGHGKDVVLIHGAMTCLDDMALALFSTLQDEFRVTAFDRPGHGRNPATTLTGTPWRQAEAVRRAAQALGLNPPVVVGHSFGGAVALAYALRYPDACAGVVALAPIAFPEGRLEHLLFGPRAGLGPLGFWSRTLGAMVDPILLPLLWRAMFLPQAMPARFAKAFPFALAGRPAQTWAEGQDAVLLAPGLAWNAAGYAACSTPIHIFAGDRDPVVNPAVHAARAVRALPNARLTTLPGLGHMIHHFAQPAIAQAIRDLHGLR